MARISAERRGTPFLVYRDDAGRQRLVDLDAAPARLCIGRHPGSDLALPWDAEASRLHAELERIAGEWTVVDDGRSRNDDTLPHAANATRSNRSQFALRIASSRSPSYHDLGER